MLLYAYIYYLRIFLLFFIKKICLYYFNFFFWWSIKFRQRDVNQPETRIGDKKLSVELYVRNNVPNQDQGEWLQFYAFCYDQVYRRDSVWGAFNDYFE